mgnify:CR=1 FL=1
MQIAKNYGINDKTIYNWIKFYKDAWGHNRKRAWIKEHNKSFNIKYFIFNIANVLSFL